MTTLGTRAPDFALPEPAGGRVWALADFDAEALVVVFTCNHCPYAQAVEERIIALARGFAGRADFVAISANDAASFPEQPHRRKLRLPQHPVDAMPTAHDKQG